MISKGRSIYCNGQGESKKYKIGKPLGYALFTARKTQDAGPATIREGIRFSLELRYSKKQYHEDVIKALRAWLTFGGIGARTRRGVGAVTLKAFTLTSQNDRQKSGFRKLTNDEDLKTWVQSLVVSSSTQEAIADYPILSGAQILWSSERYNTAEKAWERGIKALQSFRQQRYRSSHIRCPPGWSCEPAHKKRPGRSKWPEPDKIRRADGSYPTSPYLHKPNYSIVPYFPRAQLGLPIIFGFQKNSRCYKKDQNNKKRYQKFSPEEPQNYSLKWQDGGGSLRDRMASSVIIRPFKLDNNKWIALVLIFPIRFPPGKVVLVRGDSRVVGKPVAFDKISDPTDPSFVHEVLQGKTSVPDAFRAALQSNGWRHLLLDGSKR